MNRVCLVHSESAAIPAFGAQQVFPSRLSDHFSMRIRRGEADFTTRIMANIWEVTRALLPNMPDGEFGLTHEGVGGIGWHLPGVYVEVEYSPSEGLSGFYRTAGGASDLEEFAEPDALKLESTDAAAQWIVGFAAQHAVSSVAQTTGSGWMSWSDTDYIFSSHDSFSASPQGPLYERYSNDTSV